MFEERKGTLVRVHKMPEDLLRCESLAQRRSSSETPEAFACASPKRRTPAK